MKTVLIVLFTAILLTGAIAYLTFGEPTGKPFSEVQELEMQLDYICPVGFKQTHAWHLAGPKTFWLKTTDSGGETEFRFLEVQDSDLIRDLPRDTRIGRKVKLAIRYTGDPAVRNPFAKCELLGFEFLE